MRRAALALSLLAAPALADPGAGAIPAALVQAIRPCWLPPPGAVPVRVGFELARDGTVVPGSVRPIGGGAGTAGSYAAARRAILRCGAAGFRLPAGAYETWKRVEVTFNPQAGDPQAGDPQAGDAAGAGR